MTDRKIPAFGESATFFVNGSRRGEGMLLLYPDELAAVRIRRPGSWIYVTVAVACAGVSYFVFDAIGWAVISVWLIAGWWFYQALDRRRAARKVAAGGDGVTVIPLGELTSVRSRKPAKAAGWLGLRNITVTTADGTEYEFRGTMEKWHTRLAQALTARGRQVHVEAGNITVRP